MGRGLRWQLVTPPLVLLLGVAGVATWTAVASVQRARRDLETRMQRVAQALLEPPSFELTGRVLKQMSLLSGAEFIQADGHSPLTTLEQIPTDLPSPLTASDELTKLRFESRVNVNNDRFLCAGIRLSPPRTGTLYILYPQRLWESALWDAVRPSLILGGFVGITSISLAISTAQRLTGRIQALERRTRQIAEGDFSQMPLPARKDELRALGQSVNEMANKLAVLQETVQKTERLRLLGQVSGGLAHHLRNGVTGARLAVQLHQRDLARAKESDKLLPDAEALEVALRQLALLESHLKQFLELGKEYTFQPIACSMHKLIQEAARLLHPQCEHAGITLIEECAEKECLFLGEPHLMQQVLVNLVHNAMEATGPGGWVRIRCEFVNNTADKWIVLEVIDPGPGPTENVKQRLFEPFVTGKREGIGLGLAVARQIVEAHRGRVSWFRALGCTTFRVELKPHADPSTA